LTYRQCFAKLPPALTALETVGIVLLDSRMGALAMRRSLLASFAVVSLGLLAGCGGSETPAANATAKAVTPAAAPGTSGQVPSDPIAQVAYEFFDAVRQGRTVEANQRLTPLALERITAHNMNIAPPGSPTASFQVKGVTQRENDHAVVGVTWSDVDADGKPYNESIFCELKICDGQWRICGMAQDLGPNTTPMLMDFESLAGIAPQDPAKAAAAPAQGPAVAPGAQPGKQVAQDPFQAPVQR
jgi:hypothetical protein